MGDYIWFEICFLLLVTSKGRLQESRGAELTWLLFLLVVKGKENQRAIKKKQQTWDALLTHIFSQQMIMPLFYLLDNIELEKFNKRYMKLWCRENISIGCAMLWTVPYLTSGRKHAKTAIASWFYGRYQQSHSTSRTKLLPGLAARTKAQSRAPGWSSAQANCSTVVQGLWHFQMHVCIYYSRKYYAWCD